MAGTDFVTHKEDVVAHLFWAMAAIEVVTVAIAGRSISGRLLAPDPDAQAVVFEPSPGHEMPERMLRKGKIVLTKYASLKDEYQFRSQLMDIQPARWLLAIPRDIRRNDRRMVLRHELTGSQRVTVVIEQPNGQERILLLRDLSPAGLGVVYDPKLDEFVEDQVLRGKLHIPGSDTIPVRFEVIGVHEGNEEATEMVFGARFHGLGFSGCETIARIMDSNA
jgi:c-di-GMP-binding flagellar brake protein YcgR